jgi:predicted nucleic acid-binding protein
MPWVQNLHGSVVGLDTAPLIYFIEKHLTYFGLLQPFFDAVHRGQIQVVTSSLTLTEVLVLPYRLGNHNLAQNYTRILLHAPNLKVLPVSETIAQKAAEIRAAHGYKVPDAIQLATAIVGNESSFLSNDLALRQTPGINLIMLETVLAQSRFGP